MASYGISILDTFQLVHACAQALLRLSLDHFPSWCFCDSNWSISSMFAGFMIFRSQSWKLALAEVEEQEADGKSSLSAQHGPTVAGLVTCAMVAG
jgi:hypothetical protein